MENSVSSPICVRAGRVFIARLINELSGFPQHDWQKLTTEMKKDIVWWRHFIQHYNGISILWLTDTQVVDVVMAMDSSLIGTGAICNNEFFHTKYPLIICQKYTNIAHLELLAIILAIKTWASEIHGKVLHLSCDNQACVEIVNSG